MVVQVLDEVSQAVDSQLGVGPSEEDDDRHEDDPQSSQEDDGRTVSFVHVRGIAAGSGSPLRPSPSRASSRVGRSLLVRSSSARV